MNDHSSYLNIEDVLFGAIIGAFLGTFIGELTEFYIFTLVIIFVIFPVLLKYIEGRSKYALTSSSLFGVLLFWILLRILINKGFISEQKSASFLIIFLGWVISINLRSILLIYTFSKNDTSTVKIESIPIEEIKAIIFLVSDHQKKIKQNENFELENTLIYKILINLSHKFNDSNYKLKNIFLIHEDIAEKVGTSSYIARIIKDKFKNKYRIEKISIESSYDTQKCFEAIKNIYENAINKYQLKEEDIVCDSTGGTKPMSIGAALACSGKRKLVYCERGCEDSLKFLRINKTKQK